jgi:hypothetical protein
LPFMTISIISNTVTLHSIYKVLDVFPSQKKCCSRTSPQTITVIRRRFQITFQSAQTFKIDCLP